MGKNICYNIGLDIGTNSVGWAVTDQDNNLLKFNKKNMWGVRLFDDAETAQTRRVHRSTRRRLERRKARIKHLQRLIGEEVQYLDPCFFMRLKESFFYEEDKDARIPKDELKHILFNGKYSDKHYYEDFPTIYHLRDKLTKSPDKQDIRLIYLALHHIMKYRGHFLYEGQTFSKDTSDITTEISAILNYFQQDLELIIKDIDVTSESIGSVLSNMKWSFGTKKDNINMILKSDKITDQKTKLFTNAILGYKVDYSKLFDIEDEENKLNFSLNDEYDEEEKLALLDEYEEIFLKIKKIYSWVILQEVLKGEDTISSAMIVKYEKHKTDLEVLKRLFKNHFLESYSFMFKNTEEKTQNYTNYVKHIKKCEEGNGVKFKICSKEDLYKSIKNIISKKQEELKDNADYKYCIKEIDNNNFLPKQTSKDNGTIPHQLQLMELESILDNQGKYYPILVENKDKLIKLFTFRIPYYVGPLNEDSKEFAWVEKKNNQDIYPWNFEEVIDTDASAEKFIKRMVNKCTYLIDEDVVPKNSLLYSEYNLLNELNNMRIGKEGISSNKNTYNLNRPNDQLFCPEEKKRFIEAVFKKKKTVKEKYLKDWLYRNGLISSIDVQIEGYQKEKEFASSLTSYIDFTNILGEITEKNYKMIEEIICWITLFEDKDILKRKLEQKYKDNPLSEHEIRKIIALNYRGWGKLSKKLLTEISVVDAYQSRITIMDQLRDTNKNFMQIINDDKLGLNKAIEAENPLSNKVSKITLEVVEKLQGSPALKRGIWQTVRIMEEIITIMKCDPNKIIFEFARSEEASKRTSSRINRLEKLYDKMKEEAKDYNEEVHEELKKAKKDKNKLDKKALFLYFIQNGRCMYTGDSLAISQLANYEIDHIIPQSYIKDDSIENLVLVKKIENQLKSDSLLLNRDVVQKMKPMWDNLYKNGLIGAKKLRNLSRVNFNGEEIQGFINRQLVETRQISKHLAVLFKSVYADTSIFTLKAQMLSDLRNQLEIYKVRQINHYHHAHDAYLACCLNNYILKRFPFEEGKIKYGDYISKYHKNKDFLKSNKHGLIVSSFTKDYENKEIRWNATEKIAQIRKVLNYKDCNITKKTEQLTGQFYDQTIYPKGVGKIQLKQGLSTSKYGGYSSENKAYFVLIQYEYGKTQKMNIVGVPIQIAKIIKNDDKKLLKYLEDSGYKDPIILRNKILKYQLIEENGHPIFIVSDKEKHNAKQLLVSPKYIKLIYKINSNSLEDTGENHFQLDEFYQYFIDKLSKEYLIFNNVRKKLEGAFEAYTKLRFEDKIQVIKETLNLTQANGQYPSFKKYNLSDLKDRVGRMSSGSYDLYNILFIDQSVTGLFEKRSKYELENSSNY